MRRLGLAENGLPNFCPRVEQIRIHIQRHGRRRVPEHVLNHLHRGAGIDLWSYVDGKSADPTDQYEGRLEQ